MESNIGKKFGRLLIIEDSGDRTKDGSIKYKCLCDCGKVHYATITNLKKGRVKSCGCYQKESGKMNGEKHKLDLIGRRYGKLTVLSCTGEKQGSNYLWECRCDCGNITVVPTSSLTKGRTQSCGCQAKETAFNNIHEQLGLIEGTNVSLISKNTIFKTNTSGIRGVSQRKDGKYVAYIDFKGKRHTLGTFSSIERAAKARKKAEDKYFSEFLEEYKNGGNKHGK